MNKEKEEMPEEEQAVGEEEKTLLALQHKLEECQDKYLRLLADTENSRKRMQKERKELTQYSIENVIVEFLHPLDSFEKALHFAESSSEEVKGWAVGFEMILDQFKQVLLNHGIKEYDSLGNRFDPHLHDAIEMVETDEQEPGVVVEEAVRGYCTGDRTIRVARVKVSKAPEPKEEELQETNQEKEENG